VPRRVGPIRLRTAAGPRRAADGRADRRARGRVAAAGVVADDGPGHRADAGADGALTNGLVGAAAVVRVAGARRGHQPRARNRDDRLFHDEILRPVSPRKAKRWTSVAVPWRPRPAGREHRSEAERSGGMNDVTATVEPVPTDPPAEDSCELTSHVRLERVIMLINPLSGGVGPGAAEEALDILSRYAC